VWAASHMTSRLKEAQKLGFAEAVVPAAGELEAAALRLRLSRIGRLGDLADAVRPCE
jgi:DNA repair protein RadA/Sms